MTNEVRNGRLHPLVGRLRSTAARTTRLNADVALLAEAAMAAAEEIEMLCAEVDRLYESRWREGDRLDWLMAKLPGNVTRALVGEMSHTGNPVEWREKIDAAARFMTPNTEGKRPAQGTDAGPV